MKKVGIFTWHDVTKAYSCLIYLKNELSKYAKVDIWARSKFESNEDGYYSFFDTIYGRIPKVRILLSKWHVFFLAKKYDVIIVNDLDYFHSIYLIKKFYPNKIVIHYNTEIHGKDVPYSKFTEKFYEKHASYPDMIIECLKERADYRSEKYLSNRHVYTINNTLPKNEITKVINKEIDVSQYFCFDNNDLPTVAYAGGINATRSFSSLFSCLSKSAETANFMFFLYGDNKLINELREKYNSSPNCRIFDAVNRDLLLNILSKCDIGIQYYDPNVSINHYLASPSKFYEYIGVGLNILSSNNHGIDRIILENDLGLCFEKEEELPETLNRLLNKGLCSKEYISSVFNNTLCYEIDSKNTINQIIELCTLS